MSKNYYPLDIWRCLAVIFLLVGHFAPGFGYNAPYSSINFGRFGVELFFSLSGALLSFPLFVTNRPVSSFVKGRAARILPSLWFYTLLISVALLISGRHSSYPLLSFAGISNFYALFSTASPPLQLAHLWSVSLELQGYALLALFAFLKNRNTKAKFLPVIFALLTASALMALYIFSFQLDYHKFLIIPPFRLVSMFSAAAIVSLFHRSSPSMTTILMFLTAGTVLQFNFIPDPIKYSVGSLCIGISCGLLRVYCEYLDSTQSIEFYLIPIRIVSEASYSIYIWQQLLYQRDFLPWETRILLALTFGLIAHFAWDRRLHFYAKKYLLGGNSSRVGAFNRPLA